MPKRRQLRPARQAARAPTAVPPARPRVVLRVILAGMALMVVTVALAYWPALSGGFLLDDDKFLTDSPLIKAADGLYRFWWTTQPYDYWPVANTTLWFEWRVWEMNPTGYHVTNLVLHIVEALLIWVILGRLSIPGAFLAALLFAVHPVNVESVAWIAQRKTLLAMLFFLLSVLSFLQAETAPPAPPRRSAAAAGLWYWLSLTAFALAMLSKGSVAVVPLLLLLVVWWLRPLRWRDGLRILPFFVTAGLLTGINLWFEAHRRHDDIRHAGLVERLLGAASAVWFYLCKAILPIDLAFVYPQWRIDTGQLRWWLPLLASAAVTYVLWRSRRRWSRSLLFAWGFFCVALVPVMGFTDVGFMRYSLVADHYQHIALIAVVALAGAGWATWQQRVRAPTRWLPNTVAVVAVSMLTWLTWQQSRLYANGRTLYQATLAKNPDAWVAHNNLAAILFDPSRPQEAIEHFESALRLKPDYLEARYNLAVALEKTGRLPEAVEQYEQLLRLAPDDAEAWSQLALAYAGMGKVAEATSAARRAVDLARTQGQAVLVRRVEDWLNTYPAGVPAAPPLLPAS